MDADQGAREGARYANLSWKHGLWRGLVLGFIAAALGLLSEPDDRAWYFVAAATILVISFGYGVLFEVSSIWIESDRLAEKRGLRKIEIEFADIEHVHLLFVINVGDLLTVRSRTGAEISMLSDEDDAIPLQLALGQSLPAHLKAPGVLSPKTREVLGLLQQS